MIKHTDEFKREERNTSFKFANFSRLCCFSMQSLARKFESAAEHLFGSRNFAVADPNSIDAIRGESTLYPCLHPAHLIYEAKVSNDPIPDSRIAFKIGNF